MGRRVFTAVKWAPPRPHPPDAIAPPMPSGGPDGLANPAPMAQPALSGRWTALLHPWEPTGAPPGIPSCRIAIGWSPWHDTGGGFDHRFRWPGTGMLAWPQGPQNRDSSMGRIDGLWTTATAHRYHCGPVWWSGRTVASG